MGAWGGHYANVREKVRAGAGPAQCIIPRGRNRIAVHGGSCFRVCEEKISDEAEAWPKYANSRTPIPVFIPGISLPVFVAAVSARVTFSVLLSCDEPLWISPHFPAIMGFWSIFGRQHPAKNMDDNVVFEMDGADCSKFGKAALVGRIFPGAASIQSGRPLAATMSRNQP